MRRILSSLGRLLPGAQARRTQVPLFAAEWNAANERDGSRSGPLWVVLGDSTAQGIGASSIDTGYAGLVRAWLSERDGDEWRVLNLSRTGALAADVVAEQLPRLAALDPPEPSLVSVAVGANDLLRRSSSLEAALAALAAGLPTGSLIANLPRGLREARAAAVNELIAELAARHHLRLVDLWKATGPPWQGKFSGDWFHPNDTGYRDWARAFADALGDV